MTTPQEPLKLTLEEALARATQPLTPEARMQGYYIGFDRTGVALVDAILSAVAWAGKGSHHTADWNDDTGSGFYANRPGLPSALTANDLIQAAAEESAAAVRALVGARDDAAELRAAATAYVGALDAVRRYEEELDTFPPGVGIDSYGLEVAQGLDDAEADLRAALAASEGQP